MAVTLSAEFSGISWDPAESIPFQLVGDGGSPMIDASVAEAPYLSLRLRPDGRIESRGLPACQLGQPLDFGRATPDGVFAAWSWDGSTLLASNDRYGLQPLFYALN